MYDKKEQEESDWQENYRYRGVAACYHDPELPSYKGNPMIEALPPANKEEDIIPLLRYDPGYKEQYRQWASELRLHLILDAMRFIEPLTNHVALEQLIGCLIRSGYVGRNPFPRKDHLLDSRARLKRMKKGLGAPPPPQPTGREVSVIGYSGVGKSTAIRSILALYDQVINHSRYRGQPFTCRQLVYLKLECPQDGSLGGLCKAFFKEVDRLLETNTYRLYVRSGRRTIDEMLIDMAGVAERHFIGLLVIDEIQNLREAKGDGAAHVLNFLVQLDNELGIPVVLVGTPKAQSILTGEFRRARRASGLGAFPWDRMEEDGEWDVFVKRLWKYQYVRKSTPLTEELSHTLYFESQGITDLAVKIYMLAQIEAITGATKDEEEEITKELIESVAQDRFRYMQRFLNALRKNNADALKRYEDIAPLNLEFAVNEALNTLRRKQGGASTPSGAGEEQAKEQAGEANAAPDVAAEQESQSEDTPRERSNNSEAEPVLLLAFDRGNSEGVAGYDTLKVNNYTRSALEYHGAEAETVGESEALSA